MLTKIGDLPVVKYLLNENRFSASDHALIKQNINAVFKSVCGNGFHVSPSLVRDTTAEKSNIDANAVRLEILGFLLENGADIHAKDDDALRWALKDGHIHIVKFLVENGADIHAMNDDALRSASLRGNLDQVKFLIENGANIHAENDEALRLASNNGRLDIVKFLVEKGANIHALNDYALLWAAAFGHLDVVKFLVERGPYIQDNYDTAIHYSSRQRHFDIVRFLEENQANHQVKQKFSRRFIFWKKLLANKHHYLLLRHPFFNKAPKS